MSLTVVCAGKLKEKAYRTLADEWEVDALGNSAGVV